MMDADGLGLRQGTLALLPHDPRWVTAFDRLRSDLMGRLPRGVVLHHIGSTAVPGLAAKPILDIGATAPAARHAEIARVLQEAGWIDRGPRSGWLFIRLRDTDIRTHNLHLYADDDPDLVAQLAFRDQLRADPALRAAYAAEKAEIIARGTARKDYADAKTAFVRAALARP